MDILKYKGYEGTTEVDMEQGVCRGKILFIDDLVTYKAETPVKLQQEFENAVDDYLETCAELGREARKPVKGQFNVRISPSLHKEAIIAAKMEGDTLNSIVGKAVDAYVNGNQSVNHNVTVELSGAGSDTLETLIATPSSAPAWLDEKEVSYVQ